MDGPIRKVFRRSYLHIDVFVLVIRGEGIPGAVDGDDRRIWKIDVDDRTVTGRVGMYRRQSRQKNGGEEYETR